MLPRERAEKIISLGNAGWSVPAIAAQLGHSKPTIRDYLNGRRTPGTRAPRPSLLTDLLASYCRQRLVEDPHLRPSTLFDEVIELGFKGSLRTFYREMTRLQPGPPAPRTPPGTRRRIRPRHLVRSCPGSPELRCCHDKPPRSTERRSSPT